MIFYDIILSLSWFDKYKKLTIGNECIEPWLA